ncbi:uncharacterized protein EV420DRAFT_1970 [Desarmillaria tabescens]|uniref:BHLH domain-containing protein n=1 Tax=Armillaria tabescens TaxID=1929756 RepID=A0AA39NNN7_ARMTA|nr:uncharacterized protein EV420DRAFT_1970 [Desarmillaria tabescens]KAK0469007.1 hypothetical protein EV420DRAFT_1970 [Desarmillaria tabescens]
MPYTKDTYAASCNPTRRVKQAAPNVSAPISHPTLLPKRPSLPSPPAEDMEATPAPVAPVPAPAKRGRRPGTMSRSAREAQRKLNHSIIEKARRTKINEALATLRQLVPDNFGQAEEQATGEDDDDDGDDGEYGTKKKPATGKKAEKEKEFKLEILVRTVAYMQHLLEKVKEIEADGPQKKRKREDGEQEDERETVARKRPNLESDSERLPSISSWLPSIDPSLLSPSERQIQTSPRAPFDGVTQLPSPPSSARFIPIAHSFQALPALTLGPVAMEVRTLDEESAASLLLHISSSRSSTSRSSSLDGQRPSEKVNSIQPLTPGSMLGLKR